VTCRVTSSPSADLWDLHPARPYVYLDEWVWILPAKTAKGELQ
jgi:hypothetical protein